MCRKGERGNDGILTGPGKVALAPRESFNALRVLAVVILDGAISTIHPLTNQKAAIRFRRRRDSYMLSFYATGIPFGSFSDVDLGKVMVKTPFSIFALT